jgi:hypothetical protein
MSTTKEITNLRGISASSPNVLKFRLRGRLNIGTNKELEEYLN